MSKEQETIVYIISDSVGETAEVVVKATVTQFSEDAFEVRKFPYITDEETLDEVVEAAKEEEKAMIAFTLVIPKLKQHLIERAEKASIPTVDIMGPMIQGISNLIAMPPNNQPGLVRQLDEDYFRKVEAIEFAVKYDDGRDPRGLLRADIVLIGVSRTSKTPLSMYLANKRIKVANVPLVPEVEPPEELFMIPSGKCIGLTISSEKLNVIRMERLRSLGLTEQANYANMDRIQQELAYSEKIMEKVGCPVLNVSEKAVEETANIILNMYKNGAQPWE